MSKLSIYKTSWIDLVFEFKNKEYGAYQLRQESSKTSLFAFFMGLLLISSIVGVSKIVTYLSPNNGIQITVPEIRDQIIQVTDLVTPQVIEKPVLPEIKTQTTKAPIIKDQLTNLVVVHPNEAVVEVPTNKEMNNSANTTSNGTGIAVINPTNSGTGIEIAKPADTSNDIIAAVTLDKLPEFPGGIKKFYNYVGTNFERQDIEGESAIKINVSFVVEKDGSMTDIKVLKDPGYGLGKEAIRVLKSLKTKWAPGMLAGKPVRTSYNLPITIQLQ